MVAEYYEDSENEEIALEEHDVSGVGALAEACALPGGSLTSLNLAGKPENGDVMSLSMVWALSDLCNMHMKQSNHP